MTIKFFKAIDPYSFAPKIGVEIEGFAKTAYIPFYLTQKNFQTLYPDAVDDWIFENRFEKHSIEFKEKLELFIKDIT